MGYCSVANCSNCSGKNNCTSKGITFHCFPKDPDVKDKWILATGKKNWFPNKYSRICSVHFEEKDFNPTRKLRVLLNHAFPTIQVWTSVNTITAEVTHSTSSKKGMKNMTETSVIPVASSAMPRDPLSASPPKSLKRVIDLHPDNIVETASKRKMQRIIDEKANIIKTQRSKIKSLLGKNRRYKKKNMELQERIKELEKQSDLLIPICILENQHTDM